MHIKYIINHSTSNTVDNMQLYRMTYVVTKTACITTLI